MAGYTRQSVAKIVNGENIEATPLNAEFNALLATFDKTTGHTHGGGTGEAPPIPLAVGVSGYLPPANGGIGGLNNTTASADPTANDDNSQGYAPGSIWINAVTARRFECFYNTTGGAVWVEIMHINPANQILAPVTNTVDIGSALKQFKDIHIDGTGYIDTISAETINSSGNANIGGDLALSDDLSVGGSSLFTGAVTITSGSMNGVPIGVSTQQSGAFTTLTASAGITGALTGDVAGNLVGNSDGTHTGAVVGDVTGNVNATTGTSNFNNMVINGTLDMDGSSSATITNLTDPTSAQQAATKAYVDTTVANLINSAPGTLDTLNELAASLGDDADFVGTMTTNLATKLALSGGTMAGELAMGGNKMSGLAVPTANADAATKAYTDSLVAFYLPLVGGTLSGNLAMSGNKVTGLATPTVSTDAANKGYVDVILGSSVSAATSASNAATSEANAATSASSASSSKASSETARDVTQGYRNEAEVFKNLSLGYASTAAAAASQNLDAIAASISSTAVDVFVYDTSKDSDGGAWRKRTQNTSWYNETLNTSTRGSRKEFPSVAVIVAESNKVTIYDGDDPSMPMWMVFIGVGTAPTSMSFLGGTGDAVSSVAMLNGTLFFTISNAVTFNGTRSLNFISEKAIVSNSAGNKISPKHIDYRNTAFNYSTITTAGSAVVNSNCNDVAMTILPNAPIDADTGLPVPTIAVATNGGVSVIKDDGSVVDITFSSEGVVGRVAFIGDKIRLGGGSQSDLNYAQRMYDIPVSDTALGAMYVNDASALNVYFASAMASSSGFNADMFYNGTTGNKSYAVKNAIGSSSKGLTHVDENFQDATQAMVAYATSDYNTGWMNGDIKLATLSDTDTTNAVGTELVTGWVNGSTYAYDTLSTSGSTISSAITDGSNFAGASSNAMSLTAGKEYTVSFALTINSGAVLTYVFFSTAQTGGGSLGLGNYLVNIGTGNHALTFTAPSTGTFYLTLQTDNGVTTNFTTGAVSIRLAEPDRSVNGNGLQVFGTVTKTAVATGADLVGYSGFSASNYLEQPANSDITSLTSFAFTGWFKTTMTGNGYLFSLGGGSVNAGGLAVASTGGVLYSYDPTNGQDLFTTVVNDGSWHHVTFITTPTTRVVYVDGKLDVSRVVSAYTTPSNSKYRVGVFRADSGTLNNIFDGQLALQRLSATVPTAEQIAKMYRDEKHLFQENAKATLYGSSDAVTALAYDDDTELLHAGTSAGRSVFQGLRRVDNTTDAVTTAISAHKGLVVED